MRDTVMEEEQNHVERKISRHQLYTQWEQRSVVRFLHSQAFDTDEIYKNLTTACGEYSPTITELKSWIVDLEQVKEDGETVASASAGSRIGPGLATPTDPALVARVELLLVHDRRLSVERAASMSCVSYITAASVINNVLGLKKVCSRWIPRLWTPEQRAFRKSVCEELVKLYDTNQVDLDRLIVGEEAFAMYYSQDSNGPTRKFSTQASGRKMSMLERIEKDPGDKFKPTLEPKRVYCLFFFDSRGFLAAELQETNRAPDAKEYVRILKEILVPAIKRRRKEDASMYYLLQDPSPAHSSLQAKKALKEVGITTVPQPPASPDLEPQEYWLLRNIFSKVDGLNFRSVADLWKKVQRTIFQHSDVDFNKSIKALPARWNLCIERQGEILAEL